MVVFQVSLSISPMRLSVANLLFPCFAATLPKGMARGTLDIPPCQTENEGSNHAR